MTSANTLTLMKRLKAAYPRQQLGTDTLTAYAEALDDFPYQAVDRAVDNVIRTSKWFPSIAELRQEAAELLCAFPTEAQALEQVNACAVTHSLVRRAVRASVGETWPFDWKQSTSIVGLRRQFLETYRALRAEAMRDVQLEPQKFLGGNGAATPALLGGRRSTVDAAECSAPGSDGDL